MFQFSSCSVFQQMSEGRVRDTDKSDHFTLPGTALERQATPAVRGQSASLQHGGLIEGPQDYHSSIILSGLRGAIIRPPLCRETLVSRTDECLIAVAFPVRVWNWSGPVRHAKFGPIKNTPLTMEQNGTQWNPMEPNGV